MIGKIFSNHWKTAENFFQSLENRRFPVGLPDCAKPERAASRPGGVEES